MSVSQQRSLPIGSPGSGQQTWQIPVCVKYEAHGDVYSECALMTNAHAEIQLEQARGCPTWILANDDEVGYYRVAYADGLLDSVLGEEGSQLR